MPTPDAQQNSNDCTKVPTEVVADFYGLDLDTVLAELDLGEVREIENDVRMMPDELAVLDAQTLRLEQDQFERASAHARSLAEAGAELADLPAISTPLPPQLSRQEELREAARNFTGDLEADKKAKRAAGKAAFESDQAAKPRKHPDDYRYGVAGRSREEIEQYRRENPEAWNEYCRARYAVKAELEGREVREYRRDADDQKANTLEKTKLRMAKYRAKKAAEAKECLDAES